MQIFYFIWQWAVLLLFVVGALAVGRLIWRVWRISSDRSGFYRALFRLRRENLILRLCILIILIGWRIERLVELYLG